MSKKNRMTKQRKLILEILKNTNTHPTADWVYEKVKKEIPSISLGTVYRNLNLLADMGEIMVLNYGSSHSRFDGNPNNHYHFTCENCGDVFDIDISINKDLNKKVAEKTGYKVNKHRTEFYGICLKCQNNIN